MGIKEWFIRVLTPSDTEELKPGLFVQKKIVRGQDYYRQVYPGAWNGKLNPYEIFLGRNFFKTTFWFLLIMFLAFAYWHDVREYKGFYENVNSHSIDFCAKVAQNGNQVPEEYKINASTYISELKKLNPEK